jgi:uncharacterized membrane protein
MSIEQDVQQLRILVAELTRRIYRIEQRLGVEPEAERSPEPASAEAAQSIPPITEPIRPEPPMPLIPPPPNVAPPSPRLGPHLHSTATGADDLEQKIGSQWLNRIGIVAVLIGASYFLKYAFDSGWIGPAGRVAIGMLAGIGVVLWSERFRKKDYAAFSYSLKAVGIGVLYLSLWAAFQLYHLIPSGVAFGAMVIVTAATAAMAITQDAEVLAALAVMGGFLTPALVSTGENHEIVLFSYVAVLDLAMLVMLKYRPWRRLLVGTFAGTVLMYIGWYSSFYTVDQFATTWLFATIFLLLFAVAPLVVDTRSASSPMGSPALVLVALLNVLLYFLEVLVLFDQDALRDYRAWVAIALAAVYIVLGRALGVKVKQEGEDEINRVMPLLHIGMAVALLTLAIPLKLSGHWITLGWMVEAAVLFWIGLRTRMNFMKVLGLISLGLGLARLLTIDYWGNEYLIFNQRFGLYVVAIAVLAFMVASQRKELENPAVRTMVAAGVVLINLLALVALCLEVDAYWDRMIAAARPNEVAQQLPGAWREVRSMRIARDFSYSAVWMFYGAMLMVVGFWKKQPFLRWQAIVLIGATIVKVFVYDVSALDKVYRILSFLVLGAILLAISFLYQRDVLKLHTKEGGAEGSD